jgi:hypothetical protein
MYDETQVIAIHFSLAAMDLLVPRVRELIGGRQREERLERLEQRMQALGMPRELSWWYRVLGQSAASLPVEVLIPETAEDLWDGRSGSVPPTPRKI